MMKRIGITIIIFSAFAFLGVLAAADGDFNKALAFFKWAFYIGG